MRPMRIMALDQCADQYVLALAPDAALALSPRADDPDSTLAKEAAKRLRIRPSLEGAISFKPDVVVRYWGGDARLLARLERTGVTVVTIDDARDFAGIERNIQQVADAVQQPQRGADMIAQMQAKLEKAKGGGGGKQAVYLTASGFTAGPNTLIDRIMNAAGFRNGTQHEGYQAIGLERVLMQPPLFFVRGFFRHAYADWRGVGRHPALARVMRDKTSIDLRSGTLTCPAWFAADAALDLSGRGS